MAHGSRSLGMRTLLLHGTRSATCRSRGLQESRRPPTDGATGPVKQLSFPKGIRLRLSIDSRHSHPLFLPKNSTKD